MALHTQFGFTNTTSLSKTVAPTDIKAVSNYALVEDEPTSCRLTNSTCPDDQGELITLRCQKINQVNTDQDVLYPAPVTAGVQYMIKLDEILSTTSDTDPTYRVDDPIVAWVTIRHGKTSRITDAVIETVLKRLLGACYKEDGSLRFADLRKSALKPTED